MTRDDLVLVQTRIPRKVHRLIRARAEEEGISVAAYVRRMLIREFKKQLEEN
jgi:predicted HicB family RNase H-like nuclease